MECPVKDNCFANPNTDSPLPGVCKSCKDQSNFEPLYPELTVAEMIYAGMQEGVTQFHMFQMEFEETKDHPGHKEWHWDLYNKDPHKWFNIPIPWSIRFYWRGWGKGAWKGILPFGWWTSHWTFTYYKNDTIQGCQCIGGPKIGWNRGLMYALSNYHCARLLDSEKCHGDCDDCKERDFYYK